MLITFESELKQLSADLLKIKSSALPKATVQAMNKTITGVKTDVRRELTAETGIKAKVVASQLVVVKANKNTISAKIDSKTAKARNLINFVNSGLRKANHFNKRKKLKRGGRGKPLSKGVRAKAWGKAKTYKGTFIGTGKNSNTPLVFARTSSKRLPVKAIRGPSIRNTFSKPEYKQKMADSARRRFAKEFERAASNQIRLAVNR